MIQSVSGVQIGAIGAIAAEQEAAKLATAKRRSEFLPARTTGRPATRH